MTTRVVTDEQLGILSRRQNELFTRVRKGTLPIDQVLTCLQHLIEGDFDALLGRGPNIIDCDAAPSIPKGWTLAEHKRGGQLVWDPTTVALFLSDRQKGNKKVQGRELLLKELANKAVLNANVLEFLVANPQLIPESWKKDKYGRTRFIFFWGTMFHNYDEWRMVPSLHWCDWDCEWKVTYYWVDNIDFIMGSQYPAAILAAAGNR